MRFLLTLMAMAVLAVSVGCDKKPDAATTSTPSASTTTAGRTPEAPETTTSTADASAMQTVSLKLPGMTWGGCAASVKKALATVGEISDVETSEATPDGGTCSFKVPKDFDVDATLNKLVDGGASKIKGWSKAE